MSENQADVVHTDITREHVERYLQSAVVKLTEAEKSNLFQLRYYFNLTHSRENCTQ